MCLCVEMFGLPVKWESTRICESFQSRRINFIWLWNVQRTIRSRYSIDFWTNHIAKLLLIQSKCSNTRHGHVNNVTAAARDETWREFVSKSLENGRHFNKYTYSVLTYGETVLSTNFPKPSWKFFVMFAILAAMNNKTKRINNYSFNFLIYILTICAINVPNACVHFGHPHKKETSAHARILNINGRFW